MKALIWSKQHKAWWRANSQGYATNLAMAGLYEADEAEEIVKNSHGREMIVSLEKAFFDLQTQAWQADRALIETMRGLEKMEVAIRETSVLSRT